MATPISKKRKVDTEGRIFKSSWTDKYFVIEHSAGLLCLICQETIAVIKEYNIKRHYSSKHADKHDGLVGQVRIDRVNALKLGIKGQQSFFKIAGQTNESTTKVSFLISEAIAKKGKPFSDGEFVKQCLEIFTDVICPDKKSLVGNISLSHQTVARRVDDLASNIEGNLETRLTDCEFISLCLDESNDITDTAQLVIFVRGVTRDFYITEELLDLCSMKSTTTGRDIFDHVCQVLDKFKIKRETLAGITTDGAPAMMGKHSGFVALLKNCLPQNIISYHCILHQEQLCAKVLDMKHVMERVVATVNFIRSRGLNHRQFQTFLHEIDAEYGDVIYFSQVRWLSRATTLSRFWSLRHEIKFFLEEKQKDISFLNDNVWLNDLAFLVDMTKYLADLNLKLQGKDQLVNKMCEHIAAFVVKLDLLKEQIGQKNLVHFPTLLARSEYGVNNDKYCHMICMLKQEFSERFEDFRMNLTDMKIFGNPFIAEVSASPNSLQMELIDIQAQADLKDAFHRNDLVSFYQKYVQS